MRRWFTTLKLKIVTVAVVTAVLSAVGTAQLVRITTRDDIQRLLMQGDSDDSERIAARADGEMLARLVKSVPTSVCPMLQTARISSRH